MLVDWVAGWRGMRNPPACERVIYMNLANTQPTTADKPKPAPVEPSKSVSDLAPSRSIAKLPLAPRPIPGLLHKPLEHPAMPPGKAIAKADPAKPSLQEQQLTMMYAEGDANAAYDLAQLLFSQGRSEPAYVALEYAVRQKNPKAIALYSKLRPESGAQL